jgi:ParB family transcriptional regulator, chromosome partitioning protein
MVKLASDRRRPRKAKPGTKGLDPAQCRLEQSEGAAAEAAEAVEKAGGCVVGLYKEPLGGHQTLLSILPLDRIEPTPFQRDLSDAHHKRLADVISKTGRFLDPVIAVVAPGGGFESPVGKGSRDRFSRGLAWIIADIISLSRCSRSR